MAEAVTVTLAESGTTEEAVNEKLEDLGFVPSAPLSTVPGAYSAGTTYAKDALVTEGSITYRSQANGNKGNEPKADTDFVHWAPVGVSTYPLQNPDFGFPTAARTQLTHADKPPARSDAAASPEETISPGSESGLGV